MTEETEGLKDGNRRINDSVNLHPQIRFLLSLVTLERAKNFVWLFVEFLNSFFWFKFKSTNLWG